MPLWTSVLKTLAKPVGKLSGYQNLKQDQTCIYQAFTKVKGADTAQTMSNAVTSAGWNADDEAAVLILADKYGFDEAEVLSGAELAADASVAKGFDADKEIIAVITKSATVRGIYNNKIVPESAQFGNVTRGTTAAKFLVDCGVKNVFWHAIYGTTDNKGAVTWQDDQAIMNGIPVDGIAVCFFK